MTLSTVLGKKSAKGSINLFLGIVTQSVILAIGTIIVGRLLGSEFYGLYAISSIPANLIGLFAGLGIRNATIKYASQYDYRNQQKKVKETVFVGLLSTALIGLLLSILCFFLSTPLAYLFGRSDANHLIQLMSLTVLTNALIIGIQSVFIGLERTGLYSILISSRAILQSSLGPMFILVIWPPSIFGPLGGIVGYVITSIVTCIVGIVMSYFLILRKFSSSFTELEYVKRFKIMLTYGSPLYISNVAGGFLSQFMSVLMAMFISDTLIGNYKVSMNFTVLISFFAIPIATVLFPTFSKLDFNKDAETLKEVFRTSVKYTALLILPATVLVVVLSKPLVLTLYGTTYESAPFFLSIAVWIFIYVGFGQYSINSLLNGQGATRKNMVIQLVNVAVGLPLAVLLIPRFQIIGLIATTIISSFPQIVIGSFWIKRLYGLSIAWITAFKTLILSLIAGSVTFSVINLMILPNWTQLLIGTVVFTGSSFVLAPIMRVINIDDIQNLQVIFSETGPASALLHFPLQFMLKLCRQRKKSSQ